MADRLIDLGVDVRVPFGILFFVFGNRECLLHAESSTTGSVSYTHLDVYKRQI